MLLHAGAGSSCVEFFDEAPLESRADSFFGLFGFDPLSVKDRYIADRGGPEIGARRFSFTPGKGRYFFNIFDPQIRRIDVPSFLALFPNISVGILVQRKKTAKPMALDGLLKRWNKTRKSVIHLHKLQSGIHLAIQPFRSKLF